MTKRLTQREKKKLQRIEKNKTKSTVLLFKQEERKRTVLRRKLKKILDKYHVSLENFWNDESYPDSYSVGGYPETLEQYGELIKKMEFQFQDDKDTGFFSKGEYFQKQNIPQLKSEIYTNEMICDECSKSGKDYTISYDKKNDCFVCTCGLVYDEPLEEQKQVKIKRRKRKINFEKEKKYIRWEQGKIKMGISTPKQ